jgi:hypothetical protein
LTTDRYCCGVVRGVRCCIASIHAAEAFTATIGEITHQTAEKNEMLRAKVEKKTDRVILDEEIAPTTAITSITRATHTRKRTQRGHACEMQLIIMSAIIAHTCCL